MEAYKLTPSYKNYIWGGTRLKTEYGKECNLDRLAESWELSCHKDGLSTIAAGEDFGKTLYEIILNHKEYLGTKCTHSELPILIKFIDAKYNLSVQVHPPDEYALKYENDNGKNEMWYILDAADDAKIVYGLNKDYTKEEFLECIKNKKIESTLNYMPEKKGDVFFIQAGTIHAIGKNILIAEIQQTSNVTYRLFDYDRLDNNGQKRPLHINKAIEVADIRPVKVPDYAKKYSYTKNGYMSTNLVSCKYFNAEEFTIFKCADQFVDSSSFNAIVVLDGHMMFKSKSQSMSMNKGETFFVPAGYGDYKIDGIGKCLLVKI